MSRFIGFLAFFLTVYGAFHLYLLVKARRAFYLQGPPYILLFVLLAFLLIAPIHARILEAQDYHILSLIMSWVGNVWMGALFIFIWVSIPLDIYHLAMGLVRRLADVDLTALTLTRRQSFNLSSAITVLIVLYGVFEAHTIRTETVTLHSPKIPSGVGGVRIVQISDIHIGPMMIPSRIEGIVAAAKKAEPDLLISTGDLVDGRVYDPPAIVSALAGISAPLGKFAITGNHEYYAGITQAANLTEQAGFRLLQGEAVSITDFLTVVGVNDPAGEYNPQREAALLAAQPGDRFTLLLKHRPDVTPPPHFDLQLSGHTHNGQIFPFGKVVRMQYPLSCGLHRVGPQSHLYVSRGSGTWGPPIRFLSPPEVTVIDILPASAPPPEPKQKKK